MDCNHITRALHEGGLHAGSIVMLHSSLLSLGKIDGGPEAVIEAFLQAIAPGGTLVVPAFGELGVLADIVKKHPDAVISPCPKGTVAAIGPHAEKLCAGHGLGSTVHGDSTPYTRLAEVDGVICLLGVDQDRNTSLHAIEALLELPYLHDTTGTVTTPAGDTIEKTWHYYPGPHRDFIGFEKHLRAENAIKIFRLGTAHVRLIKARDMFAIGLRVGRQDPTFALCDNPACDDCVEQRAAMTRNRLTHEAFQITASSRLAGRYLPEMVDNLKAVGLAAVELDYLQGQACAGFTLDKLKRTVSDFAENDIAISALRLLSIPDAPGEIIARAVAASITRIVMPLCETSTEAARAAHDQGVYISFTNMGQPGRLAARNLAQIAVTTPCGFAFSPAAFVQAGEKPFLQSYRAGRFIKTVEQLDVVDATWTGDPVRLAHGNAEIKELISIFRCRNFSGWLCLGGGTSFPGTLKDAVADLFRLMDNM